MPITALPTPPSRNEPLTFADLGDAFLGALPTFVTQANALESNVNTKETNVTASAAAAAASASAAAASASVTLWVANGSYTAGVVKYSPITFQSFRAKTTHNTVPTDPSADATNWAQLAALPSMASNSGKFITNDGTNASWTVISQVPSTTGNIGKVLGTNGITASWDNALLTLSSTTPSVGQVLTATSSTTATWSPQAAVPLFNQLNYGGF